MTNMKALRQGHASLNLQGLQKSFITLQLVISFKTKHGSVCPGVYRMSTVCLLGIPFFPELKFWAWMYSSWNGSLHPFTVWEISDRSKIFGAWISQIFLHQSSGFRFLEGPHCISMRKGLEMIPELWTCVGQETLCWWATKTRHLVINTAGFNRKTEITHLSMEILVANMFTYVGFPKKVQGPWMVVSLEDWNEITSSRLNTFHKEPIHILSC